MLVNILNKGNIPWLNKEGPLFGYELSEGAYQILVRDARVIMEHTTPEKAAAARKAYFASKEVKKEQPVEAVTFEDKLVITEVKDEKPEVSDADLDAQLDAVLEARKDEEPAKVEPKPIKKYSKKKLSTMTKAQMKQILRDRGYTEGPNAGKYHDTVEMLIEKVLRTQE